MTVNVIQSIAYLEQQAFRAPISAREGMQAFNFAQCSRERFGPDVVTLRHAAHRGEPMTRAIGKAFTKAARWFVELRHAGRADRSPSRQRKLRRAIGRGTPRYGPVRGARRQHTRVCPPDALP
jgi:hypothetical protein